MNDVHRLRGAAILACLCLAAPAPALAQGGDDPSEAEEQAAVDAERAEAERLFSRGEHAKALRVLNELVRDDPDDLRSRLCIARIRGDENDWDTARRELLRVIERVEAPAKAGGPSAGRDATAAECLRALAELELTLGRAREAREALARRAASLPADADPRNAWVLGRVALALGERDAARGLFQAGARPAAASDWRQALARARCLRALGDLTAASHSLIEADRTARAGDGAQADVLAELAAVYFEADGEIEHPEARGRSPGELYRKALDLNPRHAAATLGLYELGRFNWNRQNRSPADILDAWLALRPASIDGLIAGAAADLDDGQLVQARGRIARLTALASGRREVRTLEATLAWIEHREADAEKLLTELSAEDPGDGRALREVGRTLCELYRFAEGRKFLARAVEADPTDVAAWTELGRALANTGDEKAGLEALRRATELAAGRQNAWRYNTAKVLERIQTQFVDARAGEHTFVWAPNAAAVLETYLVPFYADAREALAQRYGFTPGPVQIEFFERHRDFSVRSTGFEGFPALGVCFGPVVTAVSPVSEMRGTFSWARTAFHEFTHVVHLGLSHNRCPRWITEGLATWEEVNRDPSWTRNLRRELLDARANGEVIGVRDLNRAFRGPRILFAYYQSGLWCQMMIEAHGFASLVRLLEEFDRGADLDGALAQVFQATPEELDRRFAAFVDREIGALRIEPRFSEQRLLRLGLELSPTPPRDAAARETWSRGVIDLAIGHWQQGARIDAEQQLRRLDAAGLQDPRVQFLRGEIQMEARDGAGARESWERGLAMGGEDFRVRIVLGRMAIDAGEWDEAEQHLLAAERAFPGFDDPQWSAELSLAGLYRKQGDREREMGARSRWLEWNSGEYDERLAVAAWHVEAGRDAQAEALYAEANEIDPFRRKLHRAWGDTLTRLGRHAEALREYEVVERVPRELDTDKPAEMSEGERADLLGRQAGALIELGRAQAAAERIEAALKLDPDCASALEARRRSP